MKLLLDDCFDIAINPDIADEFEDVFARSSRKFQVREKQIILIILPNSKVFKSLTFKNSVCRDPKDDKFLAAAKAAKASYIVSGDKDLLVLGRFGRTEIVTVAAFLEAQRMR